MYPARLMDVWQKGDVLYLKLWNYQKNSMQIYLLSNGENLFFFVSMSFINQMSKLMTGKNNPENNQENPAKINK